MQTNTQLYHQIGKYISFDSYRKWMAEKENESTLFQNEGVTIQTAWEEEAAEHLSEWIEEDETYMLLEPSTELPLIEVSGTQVLSTIRTILHNSEPSVFLYHPLTNEGRLVDKQRHKRHFPNGCVYQTTRMVRNG